jgi:hypothetical protein
MGLMDSELNIRSYIIFTKPYLSLYTFFLEEKENFQEEQMIRDFGTPKFPRKNKGRLLVISRREGGDELEDKGRDYHCWKLLPDPDPESHPCERVKEREQFFNFWLLLCV